jgi:hypothetical protein
MVTINTIANPAVKAYSTQTAAAKAATAPAASSPSVVVSLSTQAAAPVQAAASAPPVPMVAQGQGLGARVITISNYNPSNQLTIYDGTTVVYDSTVSGSQPFTGPVINGRNAQFTLTQANIVDPFFNTAATPPTYSPQFTVKFTNSAGVSSKPSGSMRNPIPIYDVTSNTNVKRYKDVLADPTLLPAAGFNQIGIVDNGVAISRNFSTLLDMVQDNSAGGGLPQAVTGLRYSELIRPTLNLGVNDILKGDGLKIGAGAAAGKPYFYAITSASMGANPAFIQPTENFTLDEAITLSTDTVKLMRTMNVDLTADDISPANAGVLAEKIAKLNTLFATEGKLPAGQNSKFKINITSTLSDVQANIDVLGRLTRIDKITLASDPAQNVVQNGGATSANSVDQVGFSARADILANPNNPQRSLLDVTLVGNGKLNIGDTVVINGGTSAKIVGFDTATGGIGRYVLDQNYPPVTGATVLSTISSAVPLTITADQYKFNKSVLNAIGNNYQLHLSGVKASEASLMFKDPHVLDFAVEDSMANVLANATALNKIPKNFTLAIKDTVKNVVASSSNLGNLTKPYTLNITDASLDKVLQNSNVLGKLKVSYNLRDQTSEIISHADDLVKFTKNVTVAKSLSNWQNSAVVDTAVTPVAPAPSPFKISLTTPTGSPQLISVVEGSAPIDQILIDVPDSNSVSNYYSGVTVDKNNNLMQKGRVIGALVKTTVNNQSVSTYSLKLDVNGVPIATPTGQLAAGTVAGTSTFNWQPPSTFVPTDGKHNYQMIADPAVPASDTNFGIKVNGLTTTGSATIARSFTLNVISASVGGSNGLAQRYTTADPSFYMIHDSESALAHLDLLAPSPFATLLASGRLLGAISADGAPQGLSSAVPPLPPSISVPRSLNAATGHLDATLIPIIGYDRAEISNDGIVAKFKNGLTLNGVKWTDAPVLDAQSNVAEMVINSPISSIYNPATGIDNTAIMKSISKVLKINVQIDKDTTAAQITNLNGVSSVPGRAITVPTTATRSTPPVATDPVTIPGAVTGTILDPDVTINGVPIFKNYNENLHVYFDPNSPPVDVLQDLTTNGLLPLKSAQDKIKTVQDVIDAINTAVVHYKDYLKTHESEPGADQSYKNVDLTATFDPISGGVILYSQTTPTINAIDHNNIMAFTGLNFGTVSRPTGATGAISLAGVPVGTAPKGQATGQALITVKSSAGAVLAQNSVNLSLGNNADKNITTIINAINKAFNYSSSNSTYVLRATSDGTLNGGVKLSSVAGDQITVDYPNDLTNVLGVQFGSISKYLQISTLDASVLAPPDIQTALSTFANNFVLNVIDTQSNISANQLAIDIAGRGQAKITLQN